MLLASVPYSNEDTVMFSSGSELSLLLPLPALTPPTPALLASPPPPPAILWLREDPAALPFCSPPTTP